MMRGTNALMYAAMEVGLRELDQLRGTSQRALDKLSISLNPSIILIDMDARDLSRSYECRNKCAQTSMTKAIASQI